MMQPEQPSLQLLKTLIARSVAELEQAVAASDWERIQALDLKIKQSLLAIDFAKLGNDDNARGDVIQQLQQLLVSYQHTIAVCQQHKHGLQQEILGLNKGRKAAQAYQIG